ncbi:sensor histidine kinase [Georgenia wangjunii]|uniref:sensor histidine kinase n=1 Tax=Georgenia wangjunii TaxID=3117730 RepID=UPI002F26D78D
MSAGAPPLSDRPTGWTLRSRVRTALVAGGLVLGLVLLLAFAALLQVSRHESRVTEVLFDAVVSMEDAHADLVDAEGSVRAYALTADPAVRGPYDRLDVAALAAVAEEVTAALPDDGALAGALDDLLVAVEVWRTEFAEPTVARAGDGPDEAYAANRARGLALFADVRAGIDRTLGTLLDYRSDAAESLRTWRTVLVVSMVLLAVSAVAVGTVLWRLLRAWVTDPLERLAASSRAVAAGDLTAQVEGDGPDEVVGLGADVEQMRRQLVAELESVRQARSELEASNRDLEQFAYVASHDLQEPLRKVASFTQLLQRRYGGQLDERADQYIEFAVDGAKRMQRLIQDLLVFSRVGRGGEEAGVVDLDACLADALANVSDTLTTTGGQVLAADLPPVLGHRVVLTQLFQNLLSNAVKFRHPDRPPRIEIRAERSGEEWLFTCADNGIGIEPRHAERVFVIFQRLHAKDAYEGTGIGLSLCKRIIELHGGRIWVAEREPDDVGTVLHWTLPVLREEAASADGSGGARAHG